MHKMLITETANYTSLTQPFVSTSIQANVQITQQISFTYLQFHLRYQKIIETYRDIFTTRKYIYDEAFCENSSGLLVVKYFRKNASS